jgi:predicted RNase H-like HicB family nuclease
VSGSLAIIYEKGEDGWCIATIPEIPGAFSQGKTKAEARGTGVS